MNEKLLNAYINEAIKQELDESWISGFGGRTRRESARMISGQGYGNKRRDQASKYRVANTDVDTDADANEEAPQTLIGIIKQLETNLVKIEKIAGLPGQYQNLAGQVEVQKNNGRTKIRKSLLNAINALIVIARRVENVERKINANTLMESTGDAAAGAVGGGVLGYRLARRAARRAASKPAKGEGLKLLRHAAGMEQQANKPGFWTRAGKTLKTIPKSIGTAASATKNFLSGPIGGANATGLAATPVGWVIGIVVALTYIGQVAANQAAKCTRRRTIRTYNCAAVLANRMKGLAEMFKQQLEAQNPQQAQGQGAETASTQQATDGQPEEIIQEINVKRARSTFDSIEAGMSQLSEIMKQINTKLQGRDRNSTVQMPKSLNTSREIAQFQEWANAHEYKDENGAELVVDGRWGQHTKYVYDQIAAQQNGQQTAVQSNPDGETQQGAVNEGLRRDIGDALSTLENMVGVTGTGGRAYANISSMSGAKNGSRAQGARAAKFIIRTYPPVLNQYLNILSRAGANVNHIKPLKVDTRPLRNYNVNELHAIDNRIQELLGIAQNFQPEEEQFVLPNPPRRRKKPVTPPEETEKSNREELNLPTVDSSNLTQQAVSQQGSTPERIQWNPTLSDRAKQTMATAASNAVNGQLSNNQANRAINQAGRIMKQDLRAQNQSNGLSPRLSNYQRGQVRNAKNNYKDAMMNEQAFKNLVKQTILEVLNK